MKYLQIVEADAAAQADAQHKQREKLSAAKNRIARASQTYPSSVTAAHAAAAKRKLSEPPKPPKPPAPSKPANTITPFKPPQTSFRLG
jgi:hypothetical protein